MAAHGLIFAFFLETGAADPQAFRFVPPALTGLDSLFIVAATGEPRFKPQRDSAEKILVAGGAATLDYLLAKRLLDQTPRQRHYVERLFRMVSDSGRNPVSAARLAGALPSAPDSVKTQLLRVGSELGDSAFLPVARQYLRADSVEVRKNAVRSLGTYPSPANVPLLLDGLEGTRDLERQSRLWALERQSAVAGWQRLVPLLADENLYNRQLLRRILAKASGGDWLLLRPFAPDSTTGEADLEWLLLALEFPGHEARAYVRKNAALLEADERRFIESLFSRRRSFR